MEQPDDEALEAAIRACQTAALTMNDKRSFRLRVLLQMLQGELDREKLARAAGRRNGGKDHSSDTY